MSIQRRGARRSIPSNSRNVVTAQDTLHSLIPQHVRKYDAAFRVNGYRGILYNRLNAGRVCSCQSRSHSIATRLDEKGKATESAINELVMTGSFGVKSYGATSAPMPSAPAPTAWNMLEVKVGGAAPVNLGRSTFGSEMSLGAGMWAEDDVNDDTQDAHRPLPVGGISREGGGETEDFLPEVEEVPQDGRNEFDSRFFGYSDVSCPICFGSGFVGGFQPHGGWRLVLDSNAPELTLPADAAIDFDAEVPTITTSSLTIVTALPAGVSFVDAFRAWNGSKPVPFSATCDGTTLTSEVAIGAFGDGLPHTIVLSWVDPVVLTHVEIQFGNSEFDAAFELPKTSVGSSTSVLDSTDPFSITVSPRVPFVRPLDVMVESTLGKCLQVTGAPIWVDRMRSVLGWECETRVVQPVELLSMLPRRGPFVAQNTSRMVTMNSSVTAGSPVYSLGVPPAPPAPGIAYGKVYLDAAGVGAGGTPLQGVGVSLLSAGGAVLKSAVTNAAGEFFLPFKEGTYSVRVSYSVISYGAGASGIVPSVVLTSGATTGVGTVGVYEYGSIVGSVTSAGTGVAVSNVQLRTSAGVLVSEAPSGTAGNFLFTHVVPGTYVIQVDTPSGYTAALPVSVSVSSGQTVVTPVVLTPSFVSTPGLLMHFNGDWVDTYRHRTFAGGTLDTASKFGSGSMRILSTEWVTTSNDLSDLEFVGDFTISFWLRNSHSLSLTLLTLFDENGQEVWKIGTVNGEATNCITLRRGFSVVASADLCIPKVPAGDPVDSGVWTHFAIVRSAGTVVIYRDGVALATRAGYTLDFTALAVQGTNPGFFNIGPPGGFGEGCWLDELLIVPSAVYTGPFTAPSAPNLDP